MWPMKPHQITLRACHDFDWQVMASCPGCSHAIGVNTRILAGSRYGAVPVHSLLERGVFKHRDKRRGCDGVAAAGLSISCMDVGMLRTVAEWRVVTPGGSARLTRTDLPQGGSTL